MGTIFLLAALISAPPTPFDQVEAWDPQADEVLVQPQAPVDSGDQAVRALLPAIGGVAGGAALAVGLIVAGAVLAGPFSAVVYVVGYIFAAAAFVATPMITVSHFATYLPQWTSWLTGGCVVIGAGIGAVAGGIAGNAYVEAVSPPGTDCRLCTGDRLFATFGLPFVVAAGGGALGAISSTTIGAFAE